MIRPELVDHATVQPALPAFAGQNSVVNVAGNSASFNGMLGALLDSINTTDVVTSHGAGVELQRPESSGKSFGRDTATRAREDVARQGEDVQHVADSEEGDVERADEIVFAGQSPFTVIYADTSGGASTSQEVVVPDAGTVANKSVGAQTTPLEQTNPSSSVTDVPTLTIPDTGEGANAPTAGEESDPARFGTQTQRVSVQAVPRMEPAMPQQAADGLAKAGGEVPVSENAGRPVGVPANAGPTDPQASTPGLSAREQATVQTALLSSGANGSGSGSSENPAGPAPGSSASPEAGSLKAAGSQDAGQPAGTPNPGVQNLSPGAIAAAQSVSSAPATASASVESAVVKDGSAAAAKSVVGIPGNSSENSARPVAAPERSEARHAARQAENREMIARIARSIRMSREQGTTRVRMVLRPAQLGTLKVNLTIKDSVLTASLQTETAAAKHLIAGGLSDLRAALAEHGIDVDRFEVTLREESQNAQYGGQEGGSSHGTFAETDVPSFAAGEEEADEYDPMTERQRLMAATATVDYFA